MVEGVGWGPLVSISFHQIISSGGVGNLDGVRG